MGERSGRRWWRCGGVLLATGVAHENCHVTTSGSPSSSPRHQPVGKEGSAPIAALRSSNEPPAPSYAGRSSPSSTRGQLWKGWPEGGEGLERDAARRLGTRKGRYSDC